MKKMLKINSAILILIVMLNMLFPILSIAAEETVTITFQDKNLYNAILTELEDKIANSNETTYTVNITKTNLEAITELNLDSKKIENISGIEKFTALTKLELKDNGISSIEPLSTLTNLTRLNLNGNKRISDITVLSQLTNLKLLGLYNNKIQSFEPISNLTTLEQLNFSNMQISNIDFLKNLTNVKFLYLSNNNINDISTLANLKELKSLSLGGNLNLKVVSALANCTKLGELYLHNDNLENINDLRTLVNLTKLGISGNKIEDLSVIDKLSSLELTNEWAPNVTNEVETVPSNYQTIEMILTEEEAKNEINLPQIFVASKDKSSKLYTEEAPELLNCTLNADGTKVKLKDNVYKAEVTIKGGAIADSKLIIKVNDGVAPELDVKYSTTNPTNKGVTVTITSNKELQDLEGWNLSEDKLSLTKGYTKNTDEEITVQDLFGIEGKTRIVINNIDTTAPELEVKYSTTDTTKNPVTVTITSNEKLNPVTGWNLSKDQLALTKEYSQNVEEEITISDLAGNEIKIPIKIENIDMVDLEVEAECSTTELTRETVKVTIKANKAIKPIEGWILEKDGVTLTKVYTKNAKEEITVKDLAGNEKEVIITIDNIDTTAPEVEVKYSTTKTTTEGVKVEIVANEKLQELEGWELSQDKLTLTKTYTQNKEEEVTIKDLVGNERKVSIEVKNIEGAGNAPTDNTTAKDPIPQTGKTITTIASITFLILISVAEYLKIKKYKGIK